MLNHTKSRTPAQVHGARSPSPQETRMLSHTKSRAPAQVHGASSPRPHKKQVRSTTICAGCAPPLPQKPRSLRAYHAVASPATSTRSLDARSPPALRAQKRASPHETLGSTGGRHLTTRKLKKQKRTPRPRGCPRSTTRAAQPQGTCTVPGLPRSRLSSFFRVCSWFYVCAPVSHSWGRTSSVVGVHTPWRAALRAPSPIPVGRGLPPVEAKGRARAHASPVRECLRGSGRPETAYRRLGRPPRGTRRGAFGPGATHRARTVAERTCRLWGRGEPAPCTCAGAQLFVWLSIRVSCGEGEPAPCTCFGVRSFTWQSRPDACGEPRPGYAQCSDEHHQPVPIRRSGTGGHTVRDTRMHGAAPGRTPGPHRA